MFKIKNPNVIIQNGGGNKGCDSLTITMDHGETSFPFYWGDNSVGIIYRIDETIPSELFTSHEAIISDPSWMSFGNENDEFTNVTFTIDKPIENYIHIKHEPDYFTEVYEKVDCDVIITQEYGSEIIVIIKGPNPSFKIRVEST